MSARDWRPYAAVDFLRQAREAATPTADLELVAAAVQTVVTEIETDGLGGRAFGTARSKW